MIRPVATLDVIPAQVLRAAILSVLHDSKTHGPGVVAAHHVKCVSRSESDNCSCQPVVIRVGTFIAEA